MTRGIVYNYIHPSLFVTNILSVFQNLSQKWQSNDSMSHPLMGLRMNASHNACRFLKVWGVSLEAALSRRRTPVAYDVLTIVHSKSLGHCKLVIRGFACRLDAIDGESNWFRYLCRYFFQSPQYRRHSELLTCVFVTGYQYTISRFLKHQRQEPISKLISAASFIPNNAWLKTWRRLQMMTKASSGYSEVLCLS
jgi:hypothetical protein